MAWKLFAVGSLLLTSWFVQTASAHYLPRHYVYWYPQWRSTLLTIVRDNCSSQLAAYEADQLVRDCPECRLTSCILDNWNEADKANMAAVAVILGLLPTLLSLAGSNTVETGLLALRRPALAFLLAAGAPAVSPIRSFKYRNPAELLSRHPDSFELLFPPRRSVSHTFLIMAEYLAAAAAIGNLAHVSWQLGLYALCSFAGRTAYLPAVWAFIALAVHLAGAWAVRLRLELVSADDGTHQGQAASEVMTLRCGSDFLGDFVKSEFTLSGAQVQAQLRFRKETLLFVLVSWATSTGTILHLLFGTLVFSSTLFISTQDALGVAARYIAFTIVCRILVMFEVSGMRNVLSTEQSTSCCEMCVHHQARQPARQKTEP